MENPFVCLDTNMGDILIELFPEKAPLSVENFLKYVDANHYDETIFHRVVRKFVIQGGGYNRDKERKETGAPIANEANNGLSNVTGSVAMARTNDPHSATAQFFINVQDNNFLDHSDPSPNGWGYCVFGAVVEGMETVNAIKSVATTSHGPMRDVPGDVIEITNATLDTE